MSLADRKFGTINMEWISPFENLFRRRPKLIANRIPTVDYSISHKNKRSGKNKPDLQYKESK